MITLENVTKTYKNGVIALDNVSFEIKQGEFVFVIGSSGSGKSTLLKLLLKEINTTKGKIEVNNTNLRKIKNKKIPLYRRGIGVVFQDFRLLPNKTVYENVAFAMEVVEASKKEIRRDVPSVLAMVGLHKKHKCYPHELSGGEQQRTALARAIVNKPPILLADEPTGNLDPNMAWDIMNLLEDINQRGTTVLIATHAKSIVDCMEKRVIALKDGKCIGDNVKGVYGYYEDL